MTVDETPIADPSTFWAECRTTFLRWEQLRIVYNFVLVALTCMMIFGFRPELVIEPEFWMQAALAAFAANVCFFAGPIIDCYISWLGYRSRVLTYGMFGLGMAFSSLVTLVAAIVVKIPNT